MQGCRNEFLYEQHWAQRKSFVHKKLGCKSNNESKYLGVFFSIQKSCSGVCSTYLENWDHLSPQGMVGLFNSGNPPLTVRSSVSR